MREKLSPAIEDYLKVIYELTSAHGRASTSQIALMMDLKAGSVTGMIQKLAEADPPLVVYQKHRGVKLTPEGERVALEVVRHHRLIEMFLHQTLGYEWDEVHNEADRLEHVISEEFEERISQALGDPSHDPHGDPIPTRELQVPESPTHRLYDLCPGQSALVHRVRDTDPELLRYMSELGVIPGVQVTVIEKTPFDENLYISISGRSTPVILGPAITRQIFVELIRQTHGHLTGLPTSKVPGIV